MKTNRKFILLVLLASAMMVADYSYAQPYDPTIWANVQEYILGNPSESPCTPLNLNIKNTGNDILDFNGSRYEISVWDDAGGINAGIGWRVDDGTQIYQCWAQFWKSQVDPVAYVPEDPDVCIVTNSITKEVYALAVYFTPTPLITPIPGDGLYYMEVWQWDNSNKEFVPILSASGDFYPNPFGGGTNPPVPYGTSVNIDGNEDGNFVITWDNGGNIFALAGSTPGPLTSPHPGLDNDQWAFIDRGFMPDVALNCVNGPGNCLVYFAFVDPITYAPNEAVAVEQTSLSSIPSVPPPPPVTRVYDQPVTTCNNIEFPRIACPPPSSSSSQDDFHVVYLEKACNEPFFHKIHGLNGLGGDISRWVYNDGSFYMGPDPAVYDITLVPNTRPVTTYFKSGGRIWVGWEFDNTSGYYPSIPTQTGITKSMYPLAIRCLPNGKWAINSVTRYLEVPRTAIDGVTSHSLSIAGRHSSGDNLYSFYEGGAVTSSIYTKIVNQGASQLRVDETNLNHSNGFMGVLNSLLLPDGADASTYSLLLSVHDVSGKLITRDEGNIYQLERSYIALSRQLSPGIYIAGLRSADGKVYFNSKVLIANTY